MYCKSILGLNLNNVTMKRLLLFQRFFAACMFLAFSPMLRAYDAYLNGIYYNFSATEATVTYGDNGYSGNVVIPESVTYNGNSYIVKYIDWDAFYGNTDLRAITFPSSLQDIGPHAFKGCTGLTSLTIPGNVKSLSSDAFSGCSGLKTVEICDGVKLIGEGAFNSCTSLEYISIPNSVSTIDGPFLSGSTGKLYINCDIPGTTFPGGSIFADTRPTGPFSGSNITEVVIGKDVKNIGPAPFSYGPQLASLKVEEENTVFDSREDCNGIIKTSTNQLVVGCDLTRIPNGITSIGAYAFADCAFTSFTIPSGIYIIGEKAFLGCKLNSISFPTTVNTIGNQAFYECSNLTSVVFPSSLKLIENRAFSRCTQLCNVTFPENINAIVTQKVHDGFSYDDGQLVMGDYVFESCTSLPVEDNLRYADKYLVEAVNQEASSYSIRSNTKFIGQRAFRYCENIRSIIVPESVKSIGYEAFVGCTNFTSAVFPNSVMLIEERAFAGCASLISVNLPEGLTCIKSATFSGCKSLPHITIPNSVTSINGSAFEGCRMLTSVICKATNVPSLGSVVFLNVPQNNGTLGVPESAKDAYSSANQWKDFGTILPLGSAMASSVSINKTVETVTIGNQLQLNATISPGSAYQHVIWTSSNDGVATVVNGLVKALSSGTVVITASTVDGSNLKAQCTINVENTQEILATGQYTYNYSDINYILYKDGTLDLNGYGTISDNGNMPWKGYNNQITFIRIESDGISIDSDCSPFAYNCSNLKRVYINSQVFLNRCSYITCIFGKQVEEYILGDAITDIPSDVFVDCSKLTSFTIPKNITSIGSITGCKNIKSVTINSETISASRSLMDIFPDNNGNNYIKECIFGEGVKTINCCNGCLALVRVSLPESTTTIKESAFYRCNSLASIRIPSAVTSIHKMAFYECSALASVNIESDAIASKAYSTTSSLSSIFGSQVRNYTFGGGVKKIGDYACYNCQSLISVSIGNSVTSIGSNAFGECSNLSKINYDNVDGLCNIQYNEEKDNPLYYAHHLYIADSEVTDLIIPDNVTTISDYALFGSNYLNSIVFHDNVTCIGNKALHTGTETEMLVNRGSKSLLALWNAEYNEPVEKSTHYKLPPTSIKNVLMSQSTGMFRISNIYPEYMTTYEGKQLECSDINLNNLFPDETGEITLEVAMNDIVYRPKLAYRTVGLDMSAKTVTTPTTLSAVCSYKKVDARVVGQRISIMNKIDEGNEIAVTGLEPNTDYNLNYTVVVASGETSQETREYTKIEIIRTGEIIFNTLSPKVISIGEVIVGAESNITNDEEKVGFEWRRTDAPEEVNSKSGEAFLYEGTMEGYIHNLNSFNYWRFRPYYLSSAGNKFYGGWGIIEADDYSYFEPTVHTYAKVNVDGNVVEVKGYATRGSDEITEQGIAYWEENTANNSRKVRLNNSKVNKIVAIPEIAKRITSTGQVMNVTLTGLNKGCTYQYVAYVKTSTGNVYYGEQQSFKTGTAEGHSTEPYKPFSTSEVYYLYNQEADMYLCPGNSYDTQASVGEAGMDMLFEDAAGEDEIFSIGDTQCAAYAVNTRIYNSATAHYMGMSGDGASAYFDQEPAVWYFVPQEDGTFLLSSNTTGNYLYYDGVHTALAITTDTSEKGARWHVLTREDIISRMAAATADEPVNVSSLISYADFSRNGKLRVGVWQGNPSRGGNNSNFCAEKFDCNFNVYQILTDLPNGVYKVKAQAYYREGADQNYNPIPAAELRKNGNEHLYAKLYANNQEVSVKSIFDETDRCIYGYQTELGIVPNSISNAATAFLQGLYWNELTVKVSDGTLQLGIKKDEYVFYDWTCFDSFRLYYYGQDRNTGDANGNGEVEIGDVTSVLTLMATPEATGYDNKAADANGNGEIEIGDVTTILTIMAGN